MHSQAEVTQATFHYDTGQSDSFMIPIAPEEFQKQINLLLERPWLILHLFDETVFICTNRIVKVEVKPSLSQMTGIGVFANCQRVTALNRSR